LPIPSDTPFLYRFRTTVAEDGSLKVYGPRPFAQVVQYYAAEVECEARPVDGSDADWCPISEWLREYQPPPATEQQLKRLAKLGISHDRDISGEEARRLIGEAQELLPPTKGLKEKAEAAGVTVHASDTRSSLEAKIDDAERRKEVARLRSLGADVPDEATWDDLDMSEQRLELGRVLKRKGLSFASDTPLEQLEDAEYVLEDLKESAAHARQAGIRYQIVEGISIEEARVHAHALSVVGDVYESLHYYCDGRPGSPTKSTLREALQALFAQLKSGAVTEPQAASWVEERLGLNQEPARAGCLSVVALMIPLAMATVLLTVRW
jgi:hypothetical protein